MATKPSQTALLFGASRGLGLGLAREYLARGWRVIATARDDASKLEALEKGAKDNLRIERVDIADTDGIAALREDLADEKLDLLFLIAGISGSVPKPLHEVSADEAARVYLINTYYPIVAAEAFADRSSRRGTIAFMWSRLGSIAINDYGTVGDLPHEQGGAEHGRAQLLPPPQRSSRCSRSRPAGCAPTWAGRRRRSTSRRAAAMSRTRSKSTARSRATAS